jgi:hypothetical protein
MQRDNNAHSGDPLPEIFHSPDNNDQLVNVLRRLDALEGFVELLWERQREERERSWDSGYPGNEM